MKSTHIEVTYPNGTRAVFPKKGMILVDSGEGCIISYPESGVADYWPIQETYEHMRKRLRVC